ncbi:phospholipase D family protein [Flavobacteriaceae bacterium F89]|uniref:phospholipase D n=1 Tax=Cerina litoralis TaxID=2874477 RepID=A0AAE3EYH5_9FLAO|nr:phospholipase D family protein [Cerina litoralis]MCG2462071.1 phospholipase D family protein [Cerina litoralis]
MFYNNTACDIYIGTGAGKKLLQDIDNAKHSIQILSPFLSPFLIKKLILLHRKGITITLITTDEIEDFYGDRERNIHQLILQDRQMDTQAEARRNRWKIFAKGLNWIILLSALSYLAIGTLAWNVKLFLPLIPIGILFQIVRWLRIKIRSHRIYHYSYRQLFPFKVFVSPSKFGYGHTYLHGKIYLIDDQIAYLGSLNFTGGGTRSNYETRIRIADKPSVEEIRKEFHRLFQQEELPEVDIQSWGRKLYTEPIN